MILKFLNFEKIIKVKQNGKNLFWNLFWKYILMIGNVYVLWGKIGFSCKGIGFFCCWVIVYSWNSVFIVQSYNKNFIIIKLR